jgi:hypothetical protein
MCSRVGHESSAELYQRLYDLIREVVAIHVAFLDPSLLPSSAGLFV